MSRNTQKNLTAIVTGASRGIGKSIALGLAQQGYRVALFSRSLTELKVVKNSIMALENHKKINEPFIFQMDVTDLERLSHGINEIIETTGRIDVLINNAGIAKPGTFNVDTRDFEQLFRVNVLGAFNLIKAVVPMMKAQKNGHIINIASKSAITLAPEAGCYAASKLCLIGLGMSLAKELMPYAIKVSTINPGLVDTHLTDNINFPKEEMLVTNDIVNTVLYLLNLSKNAYIKDITLHCKNNLT